MARSRLNQELNSGPPYISVSKRWYGSATISGLGLSFKAGLSVWAAMIVIFSGVFLGREKAQIDPPR